MDTCGRQRENYRHVIRGLTNDSRKLIALALLNEEQVNMGGGGRKEVVIGCTGLVGGPQCKRLMQRTGSG